MQQQKFTMDNKKRDIEEVVMKEIQCPVCFSLMRSIVLCKIGHSICEECVKNLNLTRCSVCRSPFATRNRSLEAVANKLKMLKDQPIFTSNCNSRWDFIGHELDKLRTAQELKKSILTDLKCEQCLIYSFPYINVCNNGHITCGICRKCSKCNKPITTTRNLPLEAIAANIQYYCPHRSSGCPDTLTLAQSRHEILCPYNHMICPLQDANLITCNWKGGHQGLQFHLTQHVHSNIIVEKTSMKHGIMHSANTVVFAFNRLFVASTIVEGDHVYYRVYLGGSSDIASKFKCCYDLLERRHIVSRVVFPPSANWFKFPQEFLQMYEKSKITLKIDIGLA